LSDELLGRLGILSVADVVRKGRACGEEGCGVNSFFISNI